MWLPLGFTNLVDHITIEFLYICIIQISYCEWRKYSKKRQNKKLPKVDPNLYCLLYFAINAFTPSLLGFSEVLATRFLNKADLQIYQRFNSKKPFQIPLRGLSTVLDPSDCTNPRGQTMLEGPPQGLQISVVI